MKVISNIDGLKEAILSIPTFNHRRVMAAIDAFIVDMPDTDRRAMIDTALDDAPDNTAAAIQAFKEIGGEDA